MTTKIAMEFYKKNDLSIKGFQRMRINDKIKALSNDTDPATKFEWNKILKSMKPMKGTVQSKGRLPVGKGLGIDKILSDRKMSKRSKLGDIVKVDKQSNKKKRAPRKKKKVPEENKPSFKEVEDFFVKNFIDTEVEDRIDDRLYAEYDKINPKIAAASKRELSKGGGGSSSKIPPNTRMRDEAVKGSMFTKELRKFYKLVGQRHNNFFELRDLFEREFK